MATVGDDEYPLPAVSTIMRETLSPVRIALAVAPEPPPPEIVTAGSLTYPEPLAVSVMPVTKPAVAVATAAACSPASTRPQSPTAILRKRKNFTFCNLPLHGSH